MKFGFVNIYPWRPHTEQSLFMADQCRKAGHEVYFLTCRGALPNCYAREIRDESRLKGCLKCRLGSFETYHVKNVSALDANIMSTMTQKDSAALTRSSAATLTRIENPADMGSQAFLEKQSKLDAAVRISFENAKKWIADNQLDAVIGFNGRMDATKAVHAACEDLGVVYISHERGWFGDGLHLVVNGNCLGLAQLNEMVANYADHPLTRQQAEKAADFIIRRISGQQTHEWRLYNLDRQDSEWPATEMGPRILILPSSSNEFFTEEELETDWLDPTQAMDCLLDQYKGLHPSVVLRAHPNWDENIGVATGAKIWDFYSTWAKKRDICLVDPSSNMSSQWLMQQADIVVVTSSTAGMEAGFLGKRVISLAKSHYEGGGFVESFDGPEAFDAFNPRAIIDESHIIARALRYVYTHKYRYTQFYQSIKAISASQCQFYDGDVAQRLAQICREGRILPSDTTVGDSADEEMAFVEALRGGQWKDIVINNVTPASGEEIKMKRKPLFRWVSALREWVPPGDQNRA